VIIAVAGKRSMSDFITLVRFSVPGIPVAKGSLRVVPVKKKSGQLGVKFIPFQRLVEWQAAIRFEASRFTATNLPWTGPVDLHVSFRFPRPKSHFKVIEPNFPVLKTDAPLFVVRRPDLDKLMRSVLDSITGVLIKDDSQVVSFQAVKKYANINGRPGVTVIAKLIES
jgi:Holliday junction resolvase RusA-like endonuclease